MNTEERLARSLKTQPTSNKINIKGYDINYVKTGSGPTLLLIHGGNIGWGQWHPNIDEFAKYYTVYAIDLPGGGRSTRIDFKKMDFEKDLVDVVEEFIKKLGLNSINLLGSSNGGWIALKLALKNSEKINKLILVDSVGFSNYATFSDRVMSIYPLARFLTKTIFKPNKSNKKIEKLLRSVFHNQKTYIKQEFIDYFYETMESSHNLLFISRLASKASRIKMYLENELSQIKNKTLIIWGQKDKLMPIEKHSLNFPKIPNVEVKIITEAGHIPSIEKPEEFNNMVIDFLKS